MSKLTENFAVMVRHWFIQRRYLLALNMALFACWYAYNTGLLSPAAQWFNQDALYHTNISYLKSLEAKLIGDFGGLLLLSAIVDVASSSQFGISFIFDVNVQVGELMNNLSEILDKGQEFVLYGIAAIGLLEGLSVISDYASPYLFEGLILAIVGSLFTALFYFPILHSVLLKKAIKLLTMLFLLSHIIIPYSIHISSGITHVIDDLMGFGENHHYFSELTNEFGGHQTLEGSSDLKEHGKSGVHFLHKASASKLHHKVQRSSHTVMQSAAHLILTLIIVPLGLVLMIYLGLRSALSQLTILK